MEDARANGQRKKTDDESVDVDFRQAKGQNPLHQFPRIASP